MPGLFHFLRCVGKAVVKNGVRALSNLIPFGEILFDIARDTHEEYRKDHAEAKLKADLEGLAQAAPAEVRQAAEAVAAQVAADQPAEVRRNLTAYLNQLPASIRQSLRRPSDPGGCTVPPGLSLRKPEDLLPFLPAGLPRFRPGDRPLAADWELVELLGKGGFGEVWKARHLTRSRQKPVALKFCLDPVAAATLRNEAALHDHLDRVREEASAPGIVPLLETYLRADPPCLMYEFIEGGDLAGLVHEMQAQNRLTPEFATRVVHQLASTVAIAHRLNPPLVHRDLKMSNVLVRGGDGDLPDLFVADFGIGGLAAGQALREQASRRMMSSQILPTAIRGAYTPLYASPQQVQGERPDPRDDVHALGVIWYQLVTGDLRLLSIPPDWRDVVEERGLEVEPGRLLAVCIASRAEKRPVDAADLAERLAGCLAGVRQGQAEQAKTLRAASAVTRQAAEQWIRAEERKQKEERQRLFYSSAREASPAVDEPDGLVQLLPDDAVNHKKLDQKLVVREEQGVELIDGTEADQLCDLDDAFLYSNRGMDWLGKEDYEQAIKDFDKAIRLDPNHAAFYHFRGTAWYFQNAYDRAIKDFNEAIRLNPNLALAFFNRGSAWSAKEDYDRAIKDCDETIRLDPKYMLAYYNRGVAWSAKGEHDRAIKEYDEAIRLDPKYASAYHNRGHAWYLQKAYDRAIKDCDEAIRLDPKDTASYHLRGVAWSAKGEYDRAIKEYDEAIRLDPKYAFAYHNRGVAWSAKEEYDRAIKDYDEAIRLDLKNVFAYYNRGRAWDSKEAYDKAIKDYDEAIRLDPKNAWPFYNRGRAWYLKKAYDKAIKDCDEAIRLDPNFAFAFLNRSSAWRAKQEYDKAKRDYDEAIHLLEKAGILDMPITELNLSVGATNCLEFERITSIRDLVIRTDEELVEVRNFGETALHEVKSKLQERGLHLSMKLPSSSRS